MANPTFKANPYPFYARLRQDAPVCLVQLKNGMRVWLVTRYEDVAAVLKDERFIKDKAKVLNREQAARQPRIPKMFKPLERNMLDVDAPIIPGSEDWCTMRSLHGSSRACVSGCRI